MFKVVTRLTILAFFSATFAVPAQEPQEPVTLRTFVAPAYPAQARAERKQGRAILELNVAADGSVHSVKIVSAYPLFGKYAAEALGKWRFNPISHSVTLSVAVDFVLDTGECDDVCSETKVSADLPNSVRVETNPQCLHSIVN